MKLIDELRIKVCSGAGGDGIVSWLRLKHMPKGGPAGGDGGKGGDVYIKAVKDIEALRRYAGVQKLKAQDGKPGRSKSKKGLDGKDLFIELPVGSVIKFDNKEIELTDVGQIVKILDGGRGGYGNTHFKSSIDRAPKEARPGQRGRCADLHIELQIIADAGIIGMPNAGKSSLLNVLSNSKARVGNYPFTTVEPNLAAFAGFILADMPGLIEGAAENRGLGIKFLKHIKRTKLLVHLISAENEDPAKIYSVIRDELKAFDSSLLDKPELIVLSKVDLLDLYELQNKLRELKKISKSEPLLLTLNDTRVLDDFKKTLIENLQTLSS